MPLQTSLSPCFPSGFFVSVFSLLFVVLSQAVFCAASAGLFALPLQVRPVEESSHLVILLHYCLGQSGTTVVPPGRGQRPIPFFLAEDFYASPSCLLFGPRGWSSLGALRASTFSTLRLSWFSLLLSPSLSLCAPTCWCSIANLSLQFCSGAQGWSSPGR